MANKTVVVTGGGKGIGRGITRAMARAGANVVVAGRTAGPLEDATEEARALGVKALAVNVDLASLAGGAAAADRSARLAELETCRAALMVGMLIRRIESRDGAGAVGDGVRVFEDSKDSVRSRVIEDAGAVFISGLTAGVPWVRGDQSPPDPSKALIVVPRGMPVPQFALPRVRLTSRVRVAFSKDLSESSSNSREAPDPHCDADKSLRSFADGFAQPVIP